MHRTELNMCSLASSHVLVTWHLCATTVLPLQWTDLVNNHLEKWTGYWTCRPDRVTCVGVADWDSVVTGGAAKGVILVSKSLLSRCAGLSWLREIVSLLSLMSMTKCFMEHSKTLYGPSYGGWRGLRTASWRTTTWVARCWCVATGHCGWLRTGVAFNSCIVDFKFLTYAAGSAAVVSLLR